MTKKERRQIGRTPAKLTNGGFRAGKRKRGNSLLRQSPKVNTRVTVFNMHDADGNYLGAVSTLRFKRDQ